MSSDNKDSTSDNSQQGCAIEQTSAEHPKGKDSGFSSVAMDESQLGEQRKRRILFCIFLGLFILSLTGILSGIAERLLYHPNTAFLDRSAATSTKMFLSLSGIKVLVAAIESIPIIGKFAEALSDLIDYSWWGCFISMVLLKVIGFFFEFIKYLDRWPTIIITGSGVLLSWLNLKLCRALFIRKTLVGILSFTISFYIFIPLVTHGVALISDTLEAQRGNKIEVAEQTLKYTFAWDNIPNYFSRGAAEIIKNIPEWSGGISKEEYERIKQEYNLKQQAFQEKTRKGLTDLTHAFVLYLAEKLIACFLFPFALLWGGWKMTTLLCGQLNIPFTETFSQLIAPPASLSNKALRAKLSTQEKNHSKPTEEE